MRLRTYCLLGVVGAAACNGEPGADGAAAPPATSVAAVLGSPAASQQSPASASETQVFAADALDPSLFAYPACGVAGQTQVLITGSGWPEPSPPCTYYFYFDGEEIGTQADGLYGPPYLSFTIPEDAEPGCDHTIFVKLQINSGGGVVGTAEIPFCVVELVSVEWRQRNIHGSGANPPAAVPTIPAAWAGQRHFPDAAAAGGAARNQVKVRAEVAPACPNVPIYFENFDPDDGSSDDAPIDADVPGLWGDDNRGAPQQGTLGAAAVNTNAGGVAETTFTVSTQPGDNFLVAASAKADYLPGVVLDPGNGYRLVDAGGDLLPTDEGKVAPMLTIWRLLHLELDSMTGPDADENRIEGEIVDSWCFNVPGPGGGAARGVCRFEIDQRLPVEVVDGVNIDSQYHRGWFDAAGTPYALTAIAGLPVNTTGAPNNLVHAPVPGGGACPAADQPSPCAGAGEDFVMHDDDLDAIIPQSPDISWLQDTDDEGSNRLFRAFVRPVHDAGGDENDVAWVQNITDFDGQARAGKSCQSDANYWCGYLQNTFQAAYDSDCEFDYADNCQGGICTGCLNIGDVADNGALVHIETIRDRRRTYGDFPRWRRRITTHELGHTLWACHGDFGVMCYPPRASALPDAVTKFTDVSIHKVRWLERPGVLLGTAPALPCGRPTRCPGKVYPP